MDPNSTSPNGQQMDENIDGTPTTSRSHPTSQRQHFPKTDPSLYKVDQNSTTTKTSFEILRQFMSRPDEAPAQPFILQRSTSRSTNPYWSPTSSNVDRGSGSSIFSGAGGASSTKPAAGPSSAVGTPNSPLSSTSEAKNVASPSGKEEYRCPSCNRLCKSKESFEKHQHACTHRNGALTLECRFCNRPYTYVGYLQRHELECAQLARSYSHSSGDRQNPNRS